MRRREEVGEVWWWWRRGEWVAVEAVGREVWRWWIRVPGFRSERRVEASMKMGGAAAAAIDENLEVDVVMEMRVMKVEMRRQFW